MSYLITLEEDSNSICDEATDKEDTKFNQVEEQNIENKNLRIFQMEGLLKKVILDKFTLTDIISIKNFFRDIWTYYPNLFSYQNNEPLVSLITKFVFHMNKGVKRGDINDYSTLNEYKQIIGFIKNSNLKLNCFEGRDQDWYSIINYIEDVISQIITGHKMIYKRKKGYKKHIKGELKIEKLKEELKDLVNGIENSDGISEMGLALLKDRIL